MRQHPAAALDFDRERVALKENPVLVPTRCFRREFSIAPEFEQDGVLVGLRMICGWRLFITLPRPVPARRGRFDRHDRQGMAVLANALISQGIYRQATFRAERAVVEFEPGTLVSRVASGSLSPT